MLVRLAELLRVAGGRPSAVGAFTCYDLETVRAVISAADVRDVPVVILVSPGTLQAADGVEFVSALVRYADCSPVRCCVQVDHVDDLDLIERGLRAGVGAVMADGSRLTLAENISFVRDAVACAARFGADVEAELGRVEGDEDLALAVREGRLTDPAEARRFVDQTGAACLAVSIGNAHGRYAAPPRLDWPRLREIRARVDVPLALHGASGLPDVDVRQAIGLGVAKVNVNTELRDAYLSATAEAVDGLRESAAVVELHRLQTDAVASVVVAKLELFALGKQA